MTGLDVIEVPTGTAARAVFTTRGGGVSAGGFAGLNLGNDPGDPDARIRENRARVCAELGIECQLGGDGYGPSDQTPFYAAGVPVLHFFTGAHDDYHKPSDDVEHINAGGGARIANLVADVAFELTSVEGITYKASAAPPPQGDVRGYGASLGTIPDYTGAPDDKTGMLLAGVREGGPAAEAGLLKGDRVIELAGREVRDIYDLMFILREAKPGDEGGIVVMRGDERIEATVVFVESSRAR